MAESDLNNPVLVQASRIDATILPGSFSQAYTLYVIQQGTDVGNVANKANEASQGAFDAQQRNDEQDEAISQQALQLQSLRLEVDDHETRISDNTGDINSLGGRVDTAESEITDLQNNVSAIANDMVSKSAVTNQSVQSAGGSLLVGNIPAPTADPLQVGGPINAVSYKVLGIQVVGARQTGWTAASGTALKTSFNADATWTIGTTYSQSEIQAVTASLSATRKRVKALEDAMRAHGLIDG